MSSGASPSSSGLLFGSLRQVFGFFLRRCPAPFAGTLVLALGIQLHAVFGFQLLVLCVRIFVLDLNLLVPVDQLLVRGRCLAPSAGCPSECLGH